jgi:hypothetical protein
MDVLFDFHPDDGPVQTVTVFNCSPILFSQLKAGHGNQVLNDCYALECKPDGASFGSYIFRAARITNVRAKSVG